MFEQWSCFEIFKVVASGAWRHLMVDGVVVNQHCQCLSVYAPLCGKEKPSPETFFGEHYDSQREIGCRHLPVFVGISCFGCCCYEFVAEEYMSQVRGNWLNAGNTQAGINMSVEGRSFGESARSSSTTRCWQTTLDHNTCTRSTTFSCSGPICSWQSRTERFWQIHPI